MEQRDSLRVYLIDDEVLIVESLAHLLEEHFGDQALVRFFISPAILMEDFEQMPCDLLISDIRMPRMTGLEMLSRLHAVSENFETIFLTGYDIFEYAYQSIQKNAFGYLLKNESDERVLEVVDKAVEKKPKAEARLNGAWTIRPRRHGRKWTFPRCRSSACRRARPSGCVESRPR